MSTVREGKRARPVIGLVGDARPADFGAWREVDVCLVWGHYVQAIESAGGAALISPPADYLAEDPDLLLSRVDGLLLSGGRDLDAGVYGQAADPRNDDGDPVRDRVELALGRAALERQLPVLGVCRGMQLLNLIAGGTIRQHLDDPEGIHRGGPGEFVPHAVDLVPGTGLASIVGADSTEVRSHHHQGVGELGGGLRVSGRSRDGVVEALEGVDGGFCVAVLWHPEEDLDGGGLAIYGALAAAASERKERVSA